MVPPYITILLTPPLLHIAVVIIVIVIITIIILTIAILFFSCRAPILN